MSELIYDVAIVGAGPTGASLALALAQEDLRVAVIDARDPAAVKPADGRNYAIVTGSWQLLKSIGVAGELSGVAQPLHGLEAKDGGTHWFGSPSVLFTDADLDSPDPNDTLGQMLPAEPLQAALDEALMACSGIDHFAPALFESLEDEPGHVRLVLRDGRALSARLVVGADGMKSPVRQALGIATEGRDYGKSVFTANVKLSAPHNGIARQLFTPEGPFATLPLTGDRANLAWYMKRGAAEALAARPVAEAEAELNRRFAGFAGPMKIEGEAGSYPLILQLATAMIGPRAALVGDAVRRINPLAGQGLNQGFRDVAALIDVISKAVHTGLDIGSAPVLERYSQARRFDALTMSLGMDGIDRLFSNDSTLTKPIRTLGLLAAGRIAPLRRFLAKKASAAEDGVPDIMKSW
ncbi:MAG: UbiH/UbiF/VisC/COQ6 family ubiquinone biosynthesis hydroxylase [Alphaproteobacteria bacterium]|nr:UbiH/UbiF/VisC/COQ6 family ubiquinone biosynthesis hydroxylase [Alphaproteobacteria bacterium]